MTDTNFHNFFLLRRPLLSSAMLFEFNNDTIQDPGKFNDRILSIYRSEKLQQAIFLASTPLYDSLMLLFAGGNKTDTDQICKSLYKYLIRMCTRCTPFGTLAGFTTGEISSEPTRISSEKHSRMHSKVALSFEVFHALCDALSNREHIFSQLTFSLNSSLHRAFDGYHYIRRDGHNGDLFIHTQVQNSDYLRPVVNADLKQLSYYALQEILTHSGLSLQQAGSFITELYKAQIVVSELQPGTMAANQLRSLIRRLSSNKNAHVEISDLKQIDQILGSDKSFSQKAIDVNSILINYIPEQIKKNPFMVNTSFEQDHCHINEAIVSTLQKDLTELMPLASTKIKKPLDDFCDAFISRFGQRQIPLLQALDPQTGIAYGNKSLSDTDSASLLEKLTFPFASQNNTNSPELDRLRLDLFMRAITTKQQSVDLSQKDLSRFPQQQLPSCEGFYILGSLLTANGKLTDEGEFQFLHKAMGGPSAFNLMSRFCTADHVLDGQVSQSTSWEELSNPEKIFAEINHVPDFTSANILTRGQLRKYELTYLSPSNKKSEHSIDFGDLVISVTDARQVVLYSIKHKRQVCPRLTSAHNFSDGLPVYRFLCDLAQQDSGPMLNWEWGSLSQRSFLPRITYKHIILTPAIWNIDKSMFGKDSKTDRQQIWRTVRAQLQIPRYVQIIRGDQYLIIDNENIYSTQILLDAVKNQGNIRLCEFFGQPTKGLVQAECNTYCNEIIIPFLGKMPRKSSVQIGTPSSAETRSFPASEQWLYLKIYLSPVVSDRILTEMVMPFCTEMEHSKMIDKWFFIRYDDPYHHIRLRLHHGQNQNVSAHLLSRFAGVAEPYFTAGLIYKFKSDTYERELERYAGVNYSTTESLFDANSKSVIKLLGNSQLDDIIQKWHAAIVGTDMILDAVGLDLAQKSMLIEQISSSFYTEFGQSEKLLHELNDQYRLNRKTIETFLDGNITSHAIEDFRISMLPEMILYKNLSRQSLSGQYISSIIHMFVNRLFSNNHRKVELVIYHYLKKYYKSLYFRPKITEMSK